MDGSTYRPGARTSVDRLGDHKNGMLPAETNQISILIKQRRIIRSLGVLGTTRHTVPHVARNGSLAAPDSERPEDGREVGSVLLEPLHSHEFQLMQSTARRDRCRVGESASDGGGVCPSRAVPDTGCGGASRGGDVIDAGVLAESHGSSEKARGATVGECRLAFAVDGSFARARGAIGAAPAERRRRRRPVEQRCSTRAAAARRTATARSASARTRTRVVRVRLRVGRRSARAEWLSRSAGRWFARAARSARRRRSGGGGVGPSSSVLGTGCGGASHGDDAICVGALSDSRCSSEGARGAAVGKGRVAVAVGGVVGSRGQRERRGAGGAAAAASARRATCSTRAAAAVARRRRDLRRRAHGLALFE